jgi:purine-binding chemotaxis protein CheW
MSATPELPVVTFRVGGITCALPCAHVVETMRRLPITPLDDMPPFAAGLATIRGVSTPVVDLGTLLGRRCDGTRMLTVRAGARTVALLVDEVIGVTRFRASEFAGRPPLLRDSGGGLVHAIASRDHELHLILDAGRLVASGGPAA